MSYDISLERSKGSSISWVAKFTGDANSECKLSNGWSRSCREIRLLLSAGKIVVAQLQGDKSASRSRAELYDPWISGPHPLCLIYDKFMTFYLNGQVAL